MNFEAGCGLVFFNGQLYCTSDDGSFIINTGALQSSTSTIFEFIRWVRSDTLRLFELRYDIVSDSLPSQSYLHHWRCDSTVLTTWIVLSCHCTQIIETICIHQAMPLVERVLKITFRCDSIVNIRYVYTRDITILPEILTCDSIQDDSIVYLLVSNSGCDSIVIQPYQKKSSEECKKAYNLNLPNIIHPGSPGGGIFRINPAPDMFIQEFIIYDRWGNAMHNNR